MDLQRLFLFLIFIFSLGLVWDGWQRYQHPELYIQQNVPVAQTNTKLLSSSAAVISTAVVAQNTEKPQIGRTLRVKTDFFEAEINSVGGDINYLALLKHADSLDKNKPLVLLHHGKNTHNYIAQSGLLGISLPNHNTLYEADKESYELVENAEQIQIRLVPVGNFSLKVIKILTFHKSSYLVDTSYAIENVSTLPVATSSYFQLIRDSEPLAGSSKFLPTYIGAAVYTEKDKFKKVEFTDIAKGKTDYPKNANEGWIGILQHYFVAVWLAKENTPREYFTRKLEGDSYSVGLLFPEQILNPGQKVTVNSTLYLGPAQTDLDKIAPGLGLTVDYGWLTILSAPLFWVMALFNDWTGNWGVSIILLTLLIKLIFFPLSAASYRSMAKMRVVAPKLEKIKQQCGSDREKLNQSMMELYKTEKINPLGGCLPVIVQIPVFIALYWAILASVEMRYAPFFGWISDLSAADPYYILPLIMGTSMILQMRLNPKPPDPLQAKVMQIMPIAFSIIFFFFPAGLVLYSIVNNILSIGQQWYITHAAEVESKVVSAKR